MAIQHSPKDQVAGGDRRIDRIAWQIPKIVWVQPLASNGLYRVQETRQP